MRDVLTDSELDRLALLNLKQSDMDVDPAVFAQIIDVLPNGLLVINESGRILLINQQISLMFGYSRSALIGESVHMLLSPEGAALHVNHLKQFFDNPTPRPMNFARTLEGIHITGRKVPVQISIGPLITNDGVMGLALIRRATSG